MKKDKLLSFFVKDTFLYGLGLSVKNLIAFALLPLLARHYSVIEFGIIDFYLTLLLFLTVLITFGIESSLSRFFYDTDSDIERREVVNQSLIILLASLIIIITTLWLFHNSLNFLFLSNNASIILFKLILLQAPFLIFIDFSLNLLKYTFSRNKFIFLSLGSSFSYFLTIFLAILYYDIDVENLFLIGIFVKLIWSVVAIYFIRKWLRIPKKINYIINILKFAIPLGLIGISDIFLKVYQRSIVEGLHGEENLGLFSAAIKISLIMVFFAQGFQTAWGPLSLSIYKEKYSTEIFRIILKVFVIIGCIIVLIVSAFAKPIIILFFSTKYIQSSILTFPLLMSVFIMYIGWITEIGITFSKKTYLSLYSYGLFVIYGSVFIFVFSNYFGLYGVTIAILLAYSFQVIIATFFSQKAYYINWPFKSNFIILFITLVIGFFANFIEYNYQWIFSMLFIIFGLVFLTFISWFVFLELNERTLIKKIIN